MEIPTNQFQNKKTLILGGSGQDGKWLNKLLLEQGVDVLIPGREDITLTDGVSVLDFFKRHQPDSVYYLAAFQKSSESSSSYNDSEVLEKSIQTHLQGCANMLEAIAAINPNCRFFYACSARVFGHAKSNFQNEDTPLSPVCIYGISKAAGLECCRFYRNARSLHVSTGILYNHESSLGKPTFVIRKIVTTAIRILRGSNEVLRLGSLDARVDWGYAPDYVRAMQQIIQLPIPDDFIISSGETHSVQEVVDLVFKNLGLDWQKLVVEDKTLISNKIPALCGNYTKLNKMTGWRPSLTFEEMILEILKLSLHE